MVGCLLLLLRIGKHKQMHSCPLQAQSTTVICAGEGGAFIQSLEAKKTPKNDSNYIDLVLA